MKELVRISTDNTSETQGKIIALVMQKEWGAQVVREPGADYVSVMKGEHLRGFQAPPVAFNAESVPDWMCRWFACGHVSEPAYFLAQWILNSDKDPRCWPGTPEEIEGCLALMRAVPAEEIGEIEPRLVMMVERQSGWKSVGDQLLAALNKREEFVPGDPDELEIDDDGLGQCDVCTERFAAAHLVVEQVSWGDRQICRSCWEKRVGVADEQAA